MAVIMQVYKPDPIASFERKSVVITTNLVFSEWDRIFKDPMTTLAAIDRVVHHSVVLDLMAVESYGAKAAGAKSKTRTAEESAAV